MADWESSGQAFPLVPAGLVRGHDESAQCRGRKRVRCVAGRMESGAIRKFQTPRTRTDRKS